jgi:hypothetical protein
LSVNAPGQRVIRFHAAVVVGDVVGQGTAGGVSGDGHALIGRPQGGVVHLDGGRGHMALITPRSRRCGFLGGIPIGDGAVQGDEREVVVERIEGGAGGAAHARAVGRRDHDFQLDDVVVADLVDVVQGGITGGRVGGPPFVFPQGGP